MKRGSPTRSLSSCIECYWISGERPAPYQRERALPNGAITVALCLGEDPIRLFRDENDEAGRTFHGSVVWGPRTSYVVRDLTRKCAVIGIQFRAGMAGPILGVAAGDLAESHYQLDEIWDATSVVRLRERLTGASDPQTAFEILDEELLARIKGRPLLIHPAIANALETISAGPEMARALELQRQSGYSSKRFIGMFDESVGMTPKRFMRIKRLHRAVALAARGKKVSWAEVAADCGYYDQAHLNRDFRQFAGITPGEYAPSEPDRPLHVTIK